MKNHILKNYIPCKLLFLLWITSSLSYAETINTLDEHGVTFLMKISRSRDVNAVKDAIVKGADVTIRNKYNLDALIYAAMNGNKKVAELIYNNGVDKDKIDLSYLLHHGEVECASFLLDLGSCNVDYKGYIGCTPLYKAVSLNEKKLYKKLLALGADITILNTDGSSVLQAAIETENQEIIDLALKSNIKINTKDKEGAAPLHIAAKQKDYLLMKKLLEAGADINIKDSNNATIVFVSVLLNDIELLRFAIANGADINIKSTWGTPLDFAEKRNFSEIVRILKD